MKNKKLGKLAIVASGAMLLAGCSKDYAAMREYQRQAIQTKLEQMTPAEADAYIKNEMDGKVTTLQMSTIDSLYLYLWEKNDTNGTLIDEYVDYATGNFMAETQTKAQAKAEFKQLKKKQLQQEIETMRKQLDESEDLTK